MLIAVGGHTYYMNTPLSERIGDGLVSICRTGIGDSLRSVVHFTEADFDVLYLRGDLDMDRERAIEAKKSFVDIERQGFQSKETYRQLASSADSEPDIGEYELTIRVFSEGFVSRVIVGDHGVLMTTDGLDVDSFETVAVAIRILLEEL